jgi:hypothetical protein
MSIRDPSDPSPHRRRAKPRTLPSPFGFETADSRTEGGGADERDPQDGRADEPRGYRVRSEEVWQAARAEYMAGHAAEAVCAQFDLGLSAFRQRARREGWRRSDAEAEPPEPLGFPPEPEAAPPTAELADLAWRSAAQAIRRGRVYEARAWMRLAHELREAVRSEAFNAGYAQRLAALEAKRAADGAAELHGLHGEDGVQSAASGDEAAALDPARRRTLMDRVEAEKARGAHGAAVAEALSAVRELAAFTGAASNKRRPPLGGAPGGGRIRKRARRSPAGPDS